MPRRGYRKGLHDAKAPLPRYVRTRLSEEAFAALSAEASSRGITMSALTRLIVVAHNTAQRAELPHRHGTEAALLRQFIRIGNNLNQLARQANAGLVPVGTDELRACLDRIKCLGTNAVSDAGQGRAAIQRLSALARYLMRGKSGTPDPKRVAWLFTQNLPTDDPMLAAKYMEATAQLSARTRKAAYHLMIAWHENERPTPEIMQDVARKTLQMAGLAEHQALVMGHGDKPHPHLHILLNRVHPDTSRAWKTTQDYARFDRIMRELSDAHGFTFVPAHAFNPEMTDTPPKLPNSPATHAGKRGAPTLRPQWPKARARALGEEISEDLGMEATPDDELDILERHGLTLEAKGKGHVVGNAHGYVKLSGLGLTASARGRARAVAATSRVHDSMSSRQHRRNVFEVDAVDIARAFHAIGLLTKDDVRQAIDDVKAERQARRTSALSAGLTATTFLTPRSATKRSPTRSRVAAQDKSPRGR